MVLRFANYSCSKSDANYVFSYMQATIFASSYVHAFQFVTHNSSLWNMAPPFPYSGVFSMYHASHH